VKNTLHYAITVPDLESDETLFEDRFGIVIGVED